LFTDDIEWPEGDDAISPEAVDIITRLLDRDPYTRLGSHGATEVC